MENVLVFGGSGFLGSFVADELTAKGYPVVIFDKVKSRYLKANQEMVIGDILDKDTVMEYVKGMDIVYNFAGVADIEYAANMPYETLYTNFMGNLNILEACRTCAVRRYVFASTMYVYTDKGGFYRASKQACELAIEVYQQKYGLDYTILRYGSLYGPRTDEANWIHRTIKSAIVDKKIVRAGDGEEVREYIHVEDAAKSSVELLKDEFKNQNIIITGPSKIKIKELLAMIKEMFQNKIEIEYIPADKQLHYEITPYCFRPEIGKKYLINPHINLGQGLLDCIYRIHDDIQKEKKDE